MRILALAIATSGLLVAPVAMADCNRDFDRIETRIQNADMAEQNESRLLSWLEQQREVYRAADAAECTRIAAEIERQMVGYGYFADTGSRTGLDTATAQARLSGDRERTYARTGLNARGERDDIELDQAEVVVDAPPAEVSIEQPAARVNIQQKPADVAVKMQQPQVLVEVPEPQVQVTQPPPKVTVKQEDPVVDIQQPDPIVQVEQADPNVTVQQADPTVKVQQGEPEVNIEDSAPIVDVQTAEPNVQVQRHQRDAADTAAQSYASQRHDSNDAQRTHDARTGESRGAMQARQLVGFRVIDGDGRQIGEVTEVLKRQGGQQVFVLIDVEPEIGLQSDEVLLRAQTLERDADKLLVRGGTGQLERAGEFSRDGYEAADSEMVQLAGN